MEEAAFWSEAAGAIPGAETCRVPDAVFAGRAPSGMSDGVSVGDAVTAETECRTEGSDGDGVAGREGAGVEAGVLAGVEPGVEVGVLTGESVSLR
jgi:hypothetical protein